MSEAISLLFCKMCLPVNENKNYNTFTPLFLPIQRLRLHIRNIQMCCGCVIGFAFNFLNIGTNAHWLEE